MNAREHTRLINMFIGLCSSSDKWPRILRDLGYCVRLIEPMINMGSRGSVSPDVAATSNRMSHVIVADCKSGANIDGGQDARYRGLTAGDMEEHAGLRGAARPGHAVCYVVSLSNRDRLERHTSLPLIAFGEDTMRIQGSFGHRRLDAEICGEVSLAGMTEPVSYYPFSPDDGVGLIAPHVLKGLVVLLAKTRAGSLTEVGSAGTAEAVFKITHPHESILGRHRRNLIARTRHVIGLLVQSDRELEALLHRIAGGDRSASTMRRLGAVCERLARKHEAHGALDD